MARLRCEDLVVDTETHEAWRDGKPLVLTPKTFDLGTFYLRRQHVVAFDDSWNWLRTIGEPFAAGDVRNLDA